MERWPACRVRLVRTRSCVRSLVQLFFCCSPQCQSLYTGMPNVLQEHQIIGGFKMFSVSLDAGRTYDQTPPVAAPWKHVFWLPQGTLLRVCVEVDHETCYMSVAVKRLLLCRFGETITFFFKEKLSSIILNHYHSDAGLLQLLKRTYLLPFQEKAQHVPCFLFENENAAGFFWSCGRSQQMECQRAGDAKQTFSLCALLQMFFLLFVCWWDLSSPLQNLLVPALAVGVATSGSQCSALRCTKERKDEDGAGV